MDQLENQFLGCFIGLASGDALGAPYEGGIIERLVWRMIGRTGDGQMRWTDDTQMALDLAESLLSNNGLSQDDLAMRFAKSYRWSRGYGPSAARLLKSVRNGQDWRVAAKNIYPDGSYGNGAAMRAPVLALFFRENLEVLVPNAVAAAQVTHSHPIGVDGAVLIALATSLLLQRQPPEQVLSAVAGHCQTTEIMATLQVATSWLQENRLVGSKDVAQHLGNGMTAQKSCVTALYIALRFLNQSFAEMMDFIIACGGDVDTLGSMAGALWGVYNGYEQLPVVDLEQREQLENTARRLASRS